MSRSTLLKTSGIAVATTGFCIACWGVWHFSEPPMLDTRWYYGTSRQLASIGGGTMTRA
jgi:hypothetical protein